MIFSRFVNFACLMDVYMNDADHLQDINEHTLVAVLRL